MNSEEEYPSTKEILKLLGIGILLTGSILMPGLAVAAGAIYKAKRKQELKQSQKQWKKFNLSLLKRNLKRLHDQKVIEVIKENGAEVIKLTSKGKLKYLKFRSRQLSLGGQRWDRKWRLVLYDISRLKRAKQDSFRRLLKQMNFLPLQKSVYLTPYKCQQEIDYLREYFSLQEEVLVLEASKIENEDYYKQYFGI